MDNLIYDRTQLDITNLTSKGYYNYTDLNRIEEWCEYLGKLLNSYAYFVNISFKTNWTMLDFPTQSEMERIRGNINTLKQAYFAFTQVPENLENMTWQMANDIERILHEIDCISKWMENNFVYCGVASMGQNGVWQQRFRRKYSYFKMKVWNELTQACWNDFNENDTWEGVSLIANNTEL